MGNQDERPWFHTVCCQLREPAPGIIVFLLGRVSRGRGKDDIYSSGKQRRERGKILHHAAIWVAKVGKSISVNSREVWAVRGGKNVETSTMIQVLSVSADIICTKALVRID